MRLIYALLLASCFVQQMKAAPTLPSDTIVPESAVPATVQVQTGDKLTQDMIDRIVAATNAHRAHHGACPLTWNKELAADTESTFGSHNSGSMPAHASGAQSSYKIPVAAGGPAGENIAWGSRVVSTLDQVEHFVDMWYNEVHDCGPMPGCKDGKTGVVGHFTALVWRSATTLGCAITADRQSLVCRYGTPDAAYSSSCDKPTSPNMGNPGCYEANVLAEGTALPDSCSSDDDTDDQPGPEPSPEEDEEPSAPDDTDGDEQYPPEPPIPDHEDSDDDAPPEPPSPDEDERPSWPDHGGSRRSRRQNRPSPAAPDEDEQPPAPDHSGSRWSHRSRRHNPSPPQSPDDRESESSDRSSRVQRMHERMMERMREHMRRFSNGGSEDSHSSQQDSDVQGRRSRPSRSRRTRRSRRSRRSRRRL